MFPQSATSRAVTRFQNILSLVQYLEFRCCKNNLLKKKSRVIMGLQTKIVDVDVSISACNRREINISKAVLVSQ